MTLTTSTKNSILSLLFVMLVTLTGIITLPTAAIAAEPSDNFIAQHDDHSTTADEHGETADHASADDHAAEAHHAGPAAWSVIPFVVLLLMIATGPLFYAHFWHKYYPHVAAALGTIVVVYYLGFLGDVHHPIHSLAEYASFIALLTALFVSSGGILIKVDKAGTPLTNVMLLVIGAAIANIIGTTGASMLLIRPFIRLNKDRIKPYHVVFFIFMVSNVGGSLTPIGDPPLFLGFLKGVPFEWTIIHIWPKWIFGVGLLGLIFWFLDKRDLAKHTVTETTEYSGKITMLGSRNLVFLLITIIAVFIDPNVIDLPSFLYIDYHGDKLSYLREVIMFATAFAAFKTSDKEALKGNDFNFEPIREVAFLFIGIFATMMPALQLISAFASENTELVNEHSLYWATGVLSGVLDNAPTYLNFLSAGMGKMGLDIGVKEQVLQFSEGNPEPISLTYLIAVSAASVFFGAMTYIGNAPNFMVKSIAEQIGIEMPSFVGYIVRYSVPFLLPVLFLTWLVFFVLL